MANRYFKLRHVLLFLVALGTVLAACSQPAQPTPGSPAATAAVAAPTALPATKPPAPTATPDANKPVAGGRVVVAYGKDLASLDPPTAWSTVDWGNVALLVYNGLYAFDRNNNLVPELAEGMPTVSANGLVHTIKLKKGVLFHNGRELKAADVKYSIERNAKPDSGTWSAAMPMKYIVGGQALMEGKAQEASGIKVVDDYTIEFTLAEPYAYLPHALAQATNLIVPREEVEKWGQDYRFHPVGTGPFMLSEWIPKQKAVFKRNPKYFKAGLPYLDEVVFELSVDPGVALLRFQKGEIDELADGIPSADIPKVAADPQWSKYFLDTPSFNLYFLGFNLETPPFNNPKVRQAIAMAVNKERLIQLSSRTGVVASSLFHPLFACRDKNAKDPFPYNPEKAKQLLAEAGYANGFETKAWLRPGKAWTERVPEAIQQDLAAIGIKVELLQLESATGTKMLGEGQIPLWGTTWGATFPDPYSYLNDMFLSSSVTAKRLRYKNSSLDQLIAKASGTTAADARCGLWLEAEKTVLADLPAIPLFFLGWPAMQSPRVEGFVFDATYHRPIYELLWIRPKKQ